MPLTFVYVNITPLGPSNRLEKYLNLSETISLFFILPSVSDIFAILHDGRNILNTRYKSFIQINIIIFKKFIFCCCHQKCLCSICITFLKKISLLKVGQVNNNKIMSFADFLDFWWRLGIIKGGRIRFSNVGLWKYENLVGTLGYAARILKILLLLPIYVVSREHCKYLQV